MPDPLSLFSRLLQSKEAIIGWYRNGGFCARRSEGTLGKTSRVRQRHEEAVILCRAENKIEETRMAKCISLKRTLGKAAVDVNCGDLR